MSAVVRTPKLTDGEVLTLVGDLLKLAPDGTASISYHLGQSATVASETKLTKSQLDDRRRQIQTMTFEFGGSVQEVVGFHRGVVEPENWRQHPNRNGFVRSVPHAYFDELGLLEPERSYGQQPQYDKLARETVLAVAALVEAKGVEGAIVGQSDPPELTDVVMGQVHELRSLHLQMTEGLAEARLTAEKQLAARGQELEAAHAARVALLADREAELETRRKELNDREPQHERRRLREHLTARLQATISEPRLETSERERFSHYLYLAVAAIFIAVSVGLAASIDIETSNTVFWARSLKSLASGVVGAAFAWAGLSGLRASAVAAREYEQAIQRYAFDMDRASWVVETILQMNSVEQAEVPEEWLEAVCRDLFLTPGHKPEENRSLEAFAALFDATAKARIGTSGLEFEIYRKGARKLAEA